MELLYDLKGSLKFSQNENTSISASRQDRIDLSAVMGLLSSLAIQRDYQECCTRGRSIVNFHSCLDRTAHFIVSID